MAAMLQSARLAERDCMPTPKVPERHRNTEDARLSSPRTPTSLTSQAGGRKFLAEELDLWAAAEKANRAACRRAQFLAAKEQQ